jgi:hypothetical protein
LPQRGETNSNNAKGGTQLVEARSAKQSGGATLTHVNTRSFSQQLDTEGGKT